MASDYVSAVYAPPGYLLLLLGPSRGAPAGTLFSQAFDTTSLEVAGERLPVAARIQYESGLARGFFSASENGTLVYHTTGNSTTHLTWFDRTGTAVGTLGGPVPFGQPSLSPDERTVAVERVDLVTQEQDIWLIDTKRDLPSRFTWQPNNVTFMPVWSHDGAPIVFASARGAPPNLYQKSSNSGVGDELLLESALTSHPTDWSRDGRFVVYASLDTKTQWDLWLLPVHDSPSSRRPVAFLRTESNEHLGRLSPDGRWLAYVSDESGTNEVYVRRFPDGDSMTRISLKGGNEPRWNGNGTELFYLAPDGNLIAVRIELGTTVQVGPNATLFKTNTGPSSNHGFDVHYAVTRDGQRFLVSTATEQASAVSTTIMLNWTAAIPRR